MNDIKISNILVQKRRAKGITQEELASCIGVSKAAVSKWENEQSYPDITLLPRLAALFNISVDELLGYSPQLTCNDIWNICKQLSTDFTIKPFNDVMAECRTIVKDYYSCFPLLYQIAVLFVNHYIFIADEKKQNELMLEAIGLCRRIVSESGDAFLTKDALYVQCLCALMLENPDEVFEILGKSLSTQGITEDNLISHAFQLAGNSVKAKEIAQCGMYSHLMSLADAMLTYAALSEDVFDTAEFVFQRLMELIRLFNIEKLNANTTAKAYLTGINIYCKHGYLNKALDLLEKYVILCVNLFFPFKLKGDSFFTDIDEWLDSDELGSLLQYDIKMIKHNMLQSLSAQPYIAALYNEPRYKSVIQKLNDYINAE